LIKIWKNLLKDETTILNVHTFRSMDVDRKIQISNLMKITLFTENKVWLWRTFESYGFIIDIGILSADNFFFSSGCLMTYNYLRDKTNEKLIKSINYREKLIEFFSHIIKRFIRYVFRYCDLFEEECNKIYIKLLLISESIIWETTIFIVS